MLPIVRARRCRAGTVALIAMLVPFALPQAAAPQEPESRLLAVAVGGAAGVAAGGYIGLSIIVAESRVGRYVHDVDDVLGWRALPPLIGAGTGAALGAYSPERLKGSVIYGFAGMAAGAVVGLGLGAAFWDPPEGRWAGAAIGAGVGLAIGGITGMLNPPGGTAGDLAGAASAGFPIAVRIRF